MLDAFQLAAPAPERTQPQADARRRIAVRRLFIANRGEIARRIARTCERLAIEVAAAATDGPDGLDLLDPAAVIEEASAAGADALHPGYGFLAENAGFAEAVERAGIRWIGPPPSAIRTMGDKAAARHLARRLDIPVLAGYDEPAQDDATLAEAAAGIGYPVLVKPAAGGGGKGMRIVRSPDRLVENLAAARREARSAFGDDRLILERFLESPRHIEVQVLFDAHGSGVHLGERECSIQRRHQKIMEETPSPAVGERLRGRLGAAALRLAGAVGYVGAGTCEFLVDGRGRFTFLEVNTRLQVEHPVTELVTGRDLVADQIAIASGASLAELGAMQSAADEARAGGGHAIEVRLYAEDAEAGFLPAIGRIAALHWPSGDGIRVDSGVDEGTEVGGRFDPLLAKIIAHGRDRTESLARLTAALDDTLVLGLVTNLRFLRWLVRQQVVIEGRARVDTLERIWPPDDWGGRIEVPDEAWRAAATALGASGWRLNGPAVARLAVDGVIRSINVGAARDATLPMARDGDTVHVDVGGRSIAVRRADPPDVGAAAKAAVAAHHGTGEAVVTAPMPGSVIEVHVTPGATVEPGDPIVTIEAMKMEHAVPASGAGAVTEILVTVGDQIARGQVLATIESG